MAETPEKEQIDKIFEDENVLIVSPLTAAANKYYGTRGGYNEWDYDDITENGNKVYYIISKESGGKVGFYKNKNGIAYYYDGRILDESDLKDIIKSFPSAKEEIKELVDLNFFKILRKFLNGKATGLELQDSDPLIYDVDTKEKRGNSTVELSNDDRDGILELLGLNDDDIWIMRLVMFRGEYEFTDRERQYDDNINGYGIFRYFQGENVEKLKKIAQFVYPEKEFVMNSEEYLSELFKKLESPFERQLDNMTDEFIYEFNYKSSEKLRDSIQEELNEALSKINFSLSSNLSKLTTTAINLLYLYTLIGDKSLSLRQLLEKYFEDYRETKYLGGWSDNVYEYEDWNLDYDKLNNKFEWELDKILDKLEEDDNFGNYYDLLKRINSKFKLGTWYQTPKNKNIFFRISSINPDNLKLLVDLKKKGPMDVAIYHLFSEENFMKYIHNPDLFDIFDEK